MYEYQMVQIPPTITVEAKHQKGQEAALYLQELANKFAGSGWEYFRVDSLAVHTPPGCLGSFLNQSGETKQYYVVVFRRQKTAGS